MVRVSAGVGGLLPTTSQSIFYSRVGHIQLLSTVRLGGYSSGAAFLPSPPISSPCTVRLRYRFLVETDMVLIPDAHSPQLPLKLSVESSLPLTA